MKSIFSRITMSAFLKRNLGYAAVSALYIAYLVTVIRSAWMCDDAFITLRTVDNFVNGFGLTWNVGERVQVYTHPLWMFFISGLYVFTREPFYTVIFASIVLCAGAVVLLISTQRYRPAVLLLPLTVFILSRSFIDYSTSGLEQPMSFLLLALFFRLTYHKDQTPVSCGLAAITAAAATLNRTDSLLLFLPTLLVTIWDNRSLRTLIYVLVAFLPFVLWELFSLFYYGFLAPNTAFVKLGHGIPTSMIVAQGFSYFRESFKNDPLTLFAISAGILTVFYKRNRAYLPSALGVVLYCTYIVYIGGDFMSGRFFAAPLFAAVYLLLRFFENQRPKIIGAGLAAAVCLGMMSPYPTIFSDPNYGENRKVWGDLIDRTGIADERGFWFHCAGLLSDKRESGSTDCGRKAYVSGLTRRNETYIKSGGGRFFGVLRWTRDLHFGRVGNH